jgi:hypothetical protein
VHVARATKGSLLCMLLTMPLPLCRPVFSLLRSLLQPLPLHLHSLLHPDTTACISQLAKQLAQYFHFHLCYCCCCHSP